MSSSLRLALAFLTAALVPAIFTAQESFEIVLHDGFSKPVQGASVDLSGCGLGVLHTDGAGMVRFSLPEGADCFTKISKPGLSESVVAIKSGQNRINITVGTDRSALFNGIVYDAQSGRPVAGATVHARSNTGAHFNMTTTDQRGQYTLRLNPRNEYAITYAHEGYADSRYTYETGREPLSGATLPNANLSSGSSEFLDWLSRHPGGVPPRAKIEPWQEGRNNGFCIQLASGPSDFTKEANRYADLADYGKLYAKPDGTRFKLRLGIYASREDAQMVVNQIIGRYPGVFATEEPGVSDNLLWSQVYGTGRGLTAEETRARNLAPATYSTPEAPAPYSGAQAPPSLPAPQQVRLIAARTPATPPGTTAKGDLMASAPAGMQYAVQIGTFGTGQARLLNDLGALSQLGRPYARVENGATHLRIGLWTNYEQAEAAQNSALAMGFSEAAVITEKTADDPVLQALSPAQAPALQPAAYQAPVLIAPVQHARPQANAPAPQPAAAPPGAGKGVHYYIRIAALSDPSRFNPEPYRDLGAIEMRPLANGMTLVLISGFRDARETLIAQDELHARGLPEPYAVKEVNGKMERLR